MGQELTEREKDRQAGRIEGRVLGRPGVVGGWKTAATIASVENDRVRAASAGIRSRRCGCAELWRNPSIQYTVHNGPYLGRGVSATPLLGRQGATAPIPRNPARLENRCDIRRTGRPSLTYSFSGLTCSLRLPFSFPCFLRPLFSFHCSALSFYTDTRPWLRRIHIRTN